MGVLVCERYLCGDGVGGGAGAAGQLLEGFLVKAHGVIALKAIQMTAMVYSTLITTAATAKPKPFIWKVRVRHIATAPISAESTGTGRTGRG